MKPLLLILSLLISSAIGYSQQASDYFPIQLGFKWNFMVTPLDSLNNEIDPDKFFRRDSFSVTTDYEGNLANLILSKEGPAQTIYSQPYTDSSYLHFLGTNGYEYFEVGGLGEFLEFVDSLISFDNFTFVDFFTSLQAWYSVYRFAENVNNEYTIFSVDTTVSNDSLDLNLRFEYLGERLEDETITTGIGVFACKKFLIQQGVSLLFGPFPVPLVFEEDTVWITEGNWIVQDIVPATDIDLSFIGIPAFFLPGLNTGIIDPIVIPVELIDFTANSESGEVTLNWSTSTETNNLGFQIERSDEHRNFESVGFVNGSGTTTESQEYTFVDKSVELGKYYYRLKQIDYDGSIDYSRVIEVSITAPMEYQLSQNFPNPFNPNTTIEFSIPINSVVVLTVFNLVGQEVVTLVNEEFGAGNYSVVWNGTDWKGSQVSSGVYLYEIKVIGINGGEYQKMKKMILLK